MAGCIHKKFPTLEEAQAFVDGASAARATAASSRSRAASESKTRKHKRDEDEQKLFNLDVKRVKANAPSSIQQYKNIRKVYCDGSSRGNGQAGAVAGIGVFWGDEPDSP